MTQSQHVRKSIYASILLCFPSLSAPSPSRNPTTGRARTLRPETDYHTTRFPLTMQPNTSTSKLVSVLLGSLAMTSSSSAVALSITRRVPQPDPAHSFVYSCHESVVGAIGFDPRAPYYLQSTCNTTEQGQRCSQLPLDPYVFFTPLPRPPHPVTILPGLSYFDSLWRAWYR